MATFGRVGTPRRSPILGLANTDPTAQAGTAEVDRMDPITNLVIALAFLVTVDLAALNLDGYGRKRVIRRRGVR
jgi:hypothetical protein